MSYFNQATKSVGNSLSPAALKRLQIDLKQLQREPIPGTNAEPVGDNLSEWVCVVEGAEGTPFEKVPVRFALEFPNDYPNNPPHAYFLTPVSYYGGAMVEDEKGRMVVCLDLFGNFKYIHTEWGSDASGWSSGYSVSSILIQLQAMLSMGEYLDGSKHSVKRARDFVPEEKYRIEALYPETVSAPVEDTSPIQCYITKQNWDKDTDETFGFGVAVDHRGNVSSQCEPLSASAYDSGTRSSVLNKPFAYWLPIYIDAEHWERSKERFMTSISSIYDKRSKGKKLPPELQALNVLSSMMNNAVLSIMELKGNGAASDHFINGYFAMYRLLLQLTDDYPELKKQVNSDVAAFQTKKDKRSKKVVPNLGEWLIACLVSDSTWKDVAEVFIEECDARNVFWYAQGTYNSPAQYPELINPDTTKDRVWKTFKATEVSRRIVCFQTRFMAVAKEVALAELDDNLSLAPSEKLTELKEVFVRVTSMENWNDYLIWNQQPKLSDDDRCKQLIAALNLSKERGYHRSIGGGGSRNRGYRGGGRGRNRGRGHRR